MNSIFAPKGTSAKYKPANTKRDIRRLDTKINQALLSKDGGQYILGGVIMFSGVAAAFPFGGELALATSMMLYHTYMRIEHRVYNFPWRVPKHAKLFDGSKNIELLNQLNKGNVKKYKPEALYGEGVTYFGICRETGLPVYSTNSDDRTHLTCLGTTGSGKTEFLLGQVGNQLIQNSGLIYVDAKGDPSLQLNISRLARRFGRDDDILTINFITSGRNLARAQVDKVTNTFNMMADTSDGMLIELLNNLLDGGGGGSGDLWKGRAMTFIASITRVLTYLRDNGFIQLSPSTYIQYMDLPALEELVFEHEGKYGSFFSQVSASLRNYIVGLPGYNLSPKKRKKQDQKTIEQHGYIVMQLTRAINDLTYNYGYIFGVKQGDIDIFDCVLNRRILTIPLPALERSEDSMKMLGKLCIGSVKQMMAGSLGNRIQGLVREILDSRPTNSPNAFKLIFDEFGYIVISGVSVMPAQGRSLSFSICFAAQDFSDIKRGNENEAEAIWGNSNIKAIGRIVTGDNGDTMHKVNGLTGEEYQARVMSTDLEVTDIGEKYTPSASTQFSKERVLPYDDLSGQENGEFTLLVSKKEDGGVTAGVKIIRIQSFYVAGPPLKYLRMNDLCPNFSISKERLVNPNTRIDSVINKLKDTNRNKIGGESNLLHMNAFQEYGKMKSDTAFEEDPIKRIKSFLKERLDTLILEEHAIGATDTYNQSLLGENQIVNDRLAEDIKQSEETFSIKIDHVVAQETKFKSDLADQIIQDAKPIAQDHNETISVKDTLENGLVSPINIFNLSKYAEECESRLKQHHIDIVESRSNYSLLPFVPSHAEDFANSEQSEHTTKRIQEVAKAAVGKKIVSDEDRDELGAMVSGFDLNIEPPSQDLEQQKRTNRSKLINLIARFRSQIQIKN